MSPEYSDARSADAPGLPPNKGESMGGKQRVRASIACNSCRIRRGKCIFEEGQEECGQCRRTNVKCIMDNNDGRKRRRPKTDINSLKERIAAIESVIQEKSRTVSQPPNHDFSQDSWYPADQSPQHSSRNSKDSPSTPFPGSFESACFNAAETNDRGHLRNRPPRQCPNSPQPGRTTSDVLDGLDAVKKASSQPVPGQRNSYAQVDEQIHSAREKIPLDLEELIDQTMDLLPRLAEDYLLELFWTTCSSTLTFVNKRLYMQARRDRDPRYYSRGLHFCLLVVGFRYADQSRYNLQRLYMGRDRECMLYYVATQLVETELESAQVLPLIQALLLLGDCEAARGRYNKGWMYVGMASKLALQHGLDRDSTYVGLTTSEHEVRQAAFYGCLCFERYWALVLRRSPTVRKIDIKMLHCAAALLTMRANGRPALPMSPPFDVSSTLDTLISISESMQKLSGHRKGHVERNDYFMTFALDRELDFLYQGLPDWAKWNQKNVESASGGDFFFFHQHYFVDLILLHLPFAQFKQFSLLDEDLDGHTLLNTVDEEFDRSCQLSRMVCFTHAITLTKIFKQHHARFNGRTMTVHAVGHAEVAATTLFSGLIHTRDANKRKKALEYLQDMVEIIEAVSQTYEIAARMLKSLMSKLKAWQQESRTTMHDNDNIEVRFPSTRGTKIANAAADDIGEPLAKRAKTTDLSDDLGLDVQQPLVTTMPSIHASTIEVFGPFDELPRPNMLPSYQPSNEQPMVVGGSGGHMPLDIPMMGDWTMDSSWDMFLNTSNSAINSSRTFLGDGQQGFGFEFEMPRVPGSFSAQFMPTQERASGPDGRPDIELF